MRRILVCLLFLLSFNARAAIWSDAWWNPNESGWGVNISQQYNVMYLMFFVYDQNSQPHWYVAALTAGAKQPNGYEVWTGTAFTAQGPWLGGPFNPAAVTGRPVGDVTFAPQTTYQAGLTYSVDGVSVVKTIQRQTWTHIPFGGGYAGAYVVELSTCSGVTVGAPGALAIGLTVQTGADGISGTVQSAIDFDNTGACLLSGTFKQWGSIYSVANVAACATSQSAGGLSINYTDLASTDEGVDGNILLRGPSGCSIGVRFSAVRVTTQ